MTYILLLFWRDGQQFKNTQGSWWVPYGDMQPIRAWSIFSVSVPRAPFYWRDIMLRYAIIFLVIALVAGVLGFGGIAGASVGIAKILFVIFLILFVVSAIMHATRRV
jgi:uncharacterized membrane protein YtjA (UPF0391 family)